MERCLIGKEIIYFKLYKSQLPVVEKAFETAGLMLGTDKSRGYCLEMICADFLAGGSLEREGKEIIPGVFPCRPKALEQPSRMMKKPHQRAPRLRLSFAEYQALRNRVLKETDGAANSVAG